MKVKEAIEILSKLPDDEMLLMVDCPNCGRGSLLDRVDECVVLRSKMEPEPEIEQPPAGGANHVSVRELCLDRHTLERLRAIGIETLGDLTRKSEVQMRERYLFKPSTVKKIRAALAEVNLEFASEAHAPGEKATI